MCRFNAIPIKIPTSYFVDIDKLILTFMYRDKIARIANAILKKNKNCRIDPTLLNFNTNHKATAIKIRQ